MAIYLVGAIVGIAFLGEGIMVGNKAKTNLGQIESKNSITDLDFSHKTLEFNLGTDTVEGGHMVPTASS